MYTHVYVHKLSQSHVIKIKIINHVIKIKIITCYKNIKAVYIIYLYVCMYVQYSVDGLCDYTLMIYTSLCYDSQKLHSAISLVQFLS